MQVPETEIVVIGDVAEIIRKTVRPGDYIIGRDPGCDVQVDADRVSLRHAQLTVNYDHVLIEDLGSESGTLVNGQPVKETTRLWPNQKIQVGAATIELHRIKTVPPPDVSLAPSTEAVRRMLPEEFLHERKYDIGGMVAQGGMGAILDAKEAATERTVAMKVMLHAPSPDDMARFIAEAKVTAQLEHPSIVPVYELSVDENDNVFYTMKFVRGVTLRKVLELLAANDEATARKYPLPALLTVFQKVCDAVAFAHSKRVIHRDLKPDNIMIGDFGEVLVMDWGLAKRMTNDECQMTNNLSLRHSSFDIRHSIVGSATIAGTVMGTPQYMAPEQARGEVEQLDTRADVYSLGAILYHILALRPSIESEDAWEIVNRVAEGNIDPLHNRQSAIGNRKSEIPDSLAAVVRKAMALDREARYPHVAALQADITAYQNGFATSAERASAWKQIQLLLKRNKTASFGAAAVLLVGVSFGTKAVVEGRRAEREATRAKAALADLKRTAPTMLALGQSEAGFQRFDSALEKIDASLALDPQLPAAYWHRAWVLVAQQKFTEAAAAARLAAQHDPANAHLADIAPLLDTLAATPAQERWKPERTTALLHHLEEVGATGELVALAEQLHLAAQEKVQLIRQRVVEWLGKSVEKSIYADREGFVVVDLFQWPIDRLDPLRGLPIDKLWISHTHVASLEPLRGMKLRDFQASGTNIADISPLAGMPLVTISLGSMPVTDLRPLAGMHLTEISISGVNADPSPLYRMPLRKLLANGHRHLDLNAFANSPIHELDIVSGPVDLSPLLQFRALEKLTTSADAGHLNVLRGHPTLKTIQWGNDLAKPVAQFWADFDATQSQNAGLLRAKLKGLGVNTEDPSLLVVEATGRLQLHLRGETISDLSILHGFPVRTLFLKDTRVKDLSPLRDLPLEELFIYDSPGVSDLTPLKGMALKYLRLHGVPVSDLAPIAGMPLTQLGLDGTRVADLLPIKGMALEFLSLGLAEIHPAEKIATKITDLNVLRGMPIKQLALDGFIGTDFSPLLDCPKLEQLILPTKAVNIEVLRKHPGLKSLSLGWQGRWDKPAKEFWAKYDALPKGEPPK